MAQHERIRKEEEEEEEKKKKRKRRKKKEERRLQVVFSELPSVFRLPVKSHENKLAYFRPRNKPQGVVRCIVYFKNLSVINARIHKPSSNMHKKTQSCEP